MSDVNIFPCDYVYCRIKCESSTALEIQERFSFYVEGYKFMPSYKAGRWDGKIKMFDIRTRQFPIGLLPSLKEWCKEFEYTIEFSPEVPGDTEVDEGVLKSIWTASKYEPRSFQAEAVSKALRHNRCLILSPTGSGKSYIIYALIRYLLEQQEGNILINVPSIQLVEQLAKDFDDYQIDGWVVEDDLHKVYGGKEKTSKKRIILSTWQSSSKMPKDWFEQFNVFICDEAHGADSKSISSIIDNLRGAQYRFGLTGTLRDTCMHELEMRARFGELFQTITTRELMDSGELAELSIDCVRLKYNEDDVASVKNMAYQEEIEFLISHEQRNKSMCKIAATQEGNVLMLFNYIDKHGSVMLPLLKKYCAQTGKKVHYIDGGTEVDQREKIRAILEEDRNCVLLSTFGTLSTGINVKHLDVVMFCHPFKATIRTLQSIGRALRTSSTKTKAKLIDFGDDLGYTTRSGKQVFNRVFEHFVHRLSIYKDQEFPYKIIPLSFA